LKKETYADAPAWDVSHPLPHMGSLSSSEVQTVFCISESRTQTGTHTDGSAAYQLFWQVRAVAFPGGRVVGRNSFTGSPPPKTSGAGAGEGSFPYKEFAAWIFNQVDHPDFLYFSDAITSLALSPGGSIAAFGTAIANQIVDSDYRAKIFLFNPTDVQTDLQTSAFLDVLDGHQGMVTSLAFSPAGNILASSGYDLFVKFWDVTTGGLLGQISLADTPNFLAFSPDGTKLAVASNLQVSFVNPSSMQIEQSIPVASGGDIAFAPDGDHLFVSTPFRITVIDTNAGIVTLEFPDPSTLVPTMSVSADGTVVGITYESPEAVDNFALSPDGTEILTYTVGRSLDNQSGAENIRLATWDASTGKYKSETKFAGDFIGAIEISPDGRLLAMANSNAVWLWDTASWQIIRIFSGHTDLIEDLAFTPGGEKLLSASRDGTIRVWSVAE
jgi:WD40 repeat protein